MTRLGNNESVNKPDPRLDAFGTVDEANCVIGAALGLPGGDPRITEVLGQIQNDLFDLGADLATPINPDSPHQIVRIEHGWVVQLERWCDEFSVDLPPLRSFLLPGGCQLACWLNIARTVVRRAEREGWRAAEQVEINPHALRYLNRLSDLLFILGRHANRLNACPETLWVPAEAPR